MNKTQSANGATKGKGTRSVRVLTNSEQREGRCCVARRVTGIATARADPALHVEIGLHIIDSLGLYLSGLPMFDALDDVLGEPGIAEALLDGEDFDDEPPPSDIARFIERPTGRVAQAAKNEGMVVVESIVMRGCTTPTEVEAAIALARAVKTPVGFPLLIDTWFQPNAVGGISSEAPDYAGSRASLLYQQGFKALPGGTILIRAQRAPALRGQQRAVLRDPV